MKENFSQSRYIAVNENFGITVNTIYNRSTYKEKEIITAVKKHEPKVIHTAAGVVENNTLTRISGDNFSSIIEARKFIDNYSG